MGEAKRRGTYEQRVALAVSKRRSITTGNSDRLRTTPGGSKRPHIGGLARCLALGAHPGLSRYLP